MKKENAYQLIFWLFFLLLLIPRNTCASHAQSADITYKCLGGNQYQVNVSFYRDCSGANVATGININVSSVTCDQNFSTVILQIPGTGIDVTPVCNIQTTTCNGGAYPGVQEYIFQGIVTLPMACRDWTFSFSLCCRNNAINTIDNASSESIYVEAKLNNLDFSCNNSPTFSNPPVSFPCVGQTSCFNHGATEMDGDSLYYSLVSPLTSPTTTVTYLAGYTAQQPLSSSPAISFNSANGDICMNPTLQEVTVLAVKIEEWRGEIFVGSVIRDIQLRTVVCNNDLPYLTGINGTGQFAITACAGSPLNFSIPSYDQDASQTVTINWNNAIATASFASNGAQLPTGNFSWTPTIADVSTNPYCFTVTVSDNNCPFNGVQIYAFCITVGGFTTNTVSTSANCGEPNGSATAITQGGSPPYVYQWLPTGDNNANANGLFAGQYTVNVTDATGCTYSSTTNVGVGNLPASINITSTNISCFGNNNGFATAIVSGGQQPYIYLWSNGDTTASISNLASGTYFVWVTSANGCITTDSVVVTEPHPLSAVTTQTNVSCYGNNDGSATAIVNGGQQPYTYLWSNGGTTPTITNLTSGTYFVAVTSNGGCVTTDTIFISEPTLPLSVTTSQTNVSCSGGNNGSAIVNPIGGTAPYFYTWSTSPTQNSVTISGLSSGTYAVVVTDNNGCGTTQNVTITEPLPLNISANQQNVNCFGGNDGAISVTVNGGVTPYHYNWNNNTLPNGISINNLGAGNYFLTITDANGCSEINQYTITEPSELIVSISNSSDISCYGLNDGAVQTNTTGGTPPYAYQWNQSTSSACNATNLSAGNYTIIVTDSKGCSDTSSSIIQEPFPVVTVLQGEDTVCLGQSINLTATAYGGIGNYTYHWSNGNTGAVQTISPTVASTYSVYTTDGNGCLGTTESLDIIVNDISLVNLSTVPDTSLCEGVSYVISASANGGIGSYSYSWNNGLGQGFGPFTVNPLVTTNYTITVTDNCGNTINKSVEVNVNPLPKVSLQPHTKIGCGSVVLNLSNNELNPTSTNYFWDFGNGTNSSQEKPSVIYTETGAYRVVLTVSSNQGCISTTQASMNITVNPKPIAQFEFNPEETTFPKSQITFENYSLEADDYFWNFGDNENSIQVNPIHYYKEDGTYFITLIANNSYECTDTLTKKLLINPELKFYVPSAFTPNNDGKNDVFTALGEGIETFNMQIYNKWGELIYETSDLGNGWDGRAKDGISISLKGVYVYNIKIKDTEELNHKFVGKVTLIK